MKKNILSAACLLTIAYLSGAAASVLAQQGLAAQWKAEDNFLDVRGAATAVPQNSPTFAGGFVGKAFSFQTQAYLNVTNSPFPSFYGDRLDLRSFTIEGWIKPASVSGKQVLVEKTLAANETSFGDVFSLYLNGAQLTGGIRRADNMIITTSSLAGAIQADTWYHVAYTNEFPTGIQRLYVNGALVDSVTGSNITYASETGTYDLTIAAGRDTNTGQLQDYYNGLIDEISLYHRAISATEIAAIHAAGTQGKKIEGANPPANLLGWWKLDGNLQDISGNSHHGFTNTNAVYAPGFVGSALNTNPFASTPAQIQDYASMRPANITIEAWVKFGSYQFRTYIIEKSLDGSPSGMLSLYVENGILYGQIGDTTNTYVTPSYSDPNYLVDKWRHVALTFDDAADSLQVFIDGNRVSDRAVPISLTYDNNSWLIRSGSQTNPSLIDELSIYARAFPTPLSGRNEELQSIYFAGKNGKRWTQPTSVGTFVINFFNQLNVQFSETTAAGQTSVTPLDPATVGTPGNFALGAMAFEINTTATYTGDIELCFFLPDWDPNDSMGFAQLKILHREAGIWVDRTTLNDFSTLTVCGTVTSLSPFVVARQLAPTAASVSVSGRVLTGRDRGIFKAQISITNQSGETRTVLSNPFGYYSFAEVPAGETYILTAGHKRYRFSPRTLTVTEDIADFNLTAEENETWTMQSSFR